MSQLLASGGQSISPSDEYSGLVSFSIDGFDLLAVQEVLMSLLEHHIQGHQFSCAQYFLCPALTFVHDS